jgi:putative peptidoglycan binding protein
MVIILAASCLGALTIPLSIAQTSHPASSKTHSSHNKSSHSNKKKKGAKTASRRGQQKIDPQRAREIQEALVREHYLDGKASGIWDDSSQKAMQKFQADHGWQSKTTPDSRALIQLGLGPDHEHLLNPESAMTSQSLTGRPATAAASDSSNSSKPQN